MVSIPWAFYNCGIPLAIVFSVLSGMQVMVSSMLYLKTRTLCPERPGSMFEIGFLIIGRPSIFWISFTILVNSFFLIIIFFNVFGEIMKSLMITLLLSSTEELSDSPNIVYTRDLWVLLLSICLLPFVLMKELSEMKIISITLFIAALVFVAINIVQIISRGNG